MTRGQQTLRVQACEAIAEINYMREMGGVGLPWNQTDPEWRRQKIALIAKKFDAVFIPKDRPAEQEALRAKAIEVMYKTYINEYKKIWPGSRPTKADATCLMTAVLDALHDIVRVVPLEATEEMKQAALRSDDYGTRETMFRDMAADGDLTKPQETKP